MKLNFYLSIGIGLLSTCLFYPGLDRPVSSQQLISLQSLTVGATTKFRFETQQEGWWFTDKQGKWVQGWWFTGNAGLDYGKNLERTGRGNGWVRNYSGWNAINNWISVIPHQYCTLSAWVRTSNTLTDGYISVRDMDANGNVARVINEIKLVGSGSPNPQEKNYNYHTFKFKADERDRVLFYVGLWGNGKDSWIQVDDVDVYCPPSSTY